MVISDLGDHDVVQWIDAHPDQEQALYCTAADILMKLADCSPPDGLNRMTPDVGAEMIMVVGEHYTSRDLTDLHHEMKSALERHAADANTLSLRDFHAENLIWREAHNGTDRIGLLDFQDAFIAPAGYDIASLLRDARRDVPQAVVDNTLDYFMKKSGAAPTFTTQVACLGVQRNLRILGIFARLSKQMGKTRYLQFLPRVWANILSDLDHPALGGLRGAVLEAIPEPTPTFCEGLKP
jgi:aminoglycoside/choline kinase family phosphotransferase